MPWSSMVTTFFTTSVTISGFNTSEPTPTGTAQPTATVAATATAAVTLPQTGAGDQGSGGATGWLIAALLGSAALAAAGYGALRLQSRRP